MNEDRPTVMQAALAAGLAPDWQGRARREAAAILAEWSPTPRTLDRDTLAGLLAIAWLQGTIYGSHETLSAAERAFDRLRDEL